MQNFKTNLKVWFDDVKKNYLNTKQAAKAVCNLRLQYIQSYRFNIPYSLYFYILINLYP